MACGIPAPRDENRSLACQKRNTCREGEYYSDVVKQRSLSKHGVFNDKLEQTGNVVRNEMVGFTMG